jgi:hypothetical protein
MNEVIEQYNHNYSIIITGKYYKLFIIPHMKKSNKLCVWSADEFIIATCLWLACKLLAEWCNLFVTCRMFVPWHYKCQSREFSNFKKFENWVFSNFKKIENWVACDSTVRNLFDIFICKKKLIFIVHNFLMNIILSVIYSFA